MITVPNAATYFATGNNLTFVGDVTRRGIRGRLDAGVERPELREFTTEDPVETVKRERPKYVSVCLTILRAYIVAGAPGQTRPLGSFEEWSRLVRDALVWLGRPILSTRWSAHARKIRGARRSPRPGTVERPARLGTRVREGRDRQGDRLRTCSSPSDFNRKSFLHPEFREALLTVAGDGGNISGKRLGNGFPPIKERSSTGCASSLTALSRV